MRSSKALALKRAKKSAKAASDSGVKYVKVTLNKKGSEQISRKFYDSRKDQSNYEFVCVAE